MSSDRYRRFFFRLADYNADEALRCLVKEHCDDIETDWYPGTVVCTDPHGDPWSRQDIENYCIEKKIAFDRWYEADLERPATYRIYRPGDEPIDKICDVDVIDARPYMFCDAIASILASKSSTDKEKLNWIANAVQHSDFPCPRIYDYRSPRESEGG